MERWVPALQKTFCSIGACRFSGLATTEGRAFVADERVAIDDLLLVDAEDVTVAAVVKDLTLLEEEKLGSDIVLGLGLADVEEDWPGRDQGVDHVVAGLKLAEGAHVEIERVAGDLLGGQRLVGLNEGVVDVGLAGVDEGGLLWGAGYAEAVERLGAGEAQGESCSEFWLKPRSSQGRKRAGRSNR